jgi:serine/threonine protein phosphatase PrpC
MDGQKQTFFCRAGLLCTLVGEGAPEEQFSLSFHPPILSPSFFAFLLVFTPIHPECPFSPFYHLLVPSPCFSCIQSAGPLPPLLLFLLLLYKEQFPTPNLAECSQEELVKYAMQLLSVDGRTQSTKSKLERTITCGSSSENPKTTFSLKFAGVSQTGFDPSEVARLNQSNFFTQEDVEDMDNMAVFGVFDGHGKYGHHLAQYCKSRFSKKIGKSKMTELMSEKAKLEAQKLMSFCIYKDDGNSDDDSSDNDEELPKEPTPPPSPKKTATIDLNKLLGTNSTTINQMARFSVKEDREVQPEKQKQPLKEEPKAEKKIVHTCLEAVFKTTDEDIILHSSRRKRGTDHGKDTDGKTNDAGKNLDAQHKEDQDLLLRSVDVDDIGMAFSGVSASVVVVEDQTIWVAHAGDVRVVLAEESKQVDENAVQGRRRGSIVPVEHRTQSLNVKVGKPKAVKCEVGKPKLIAHPLMVDHTPYREDERNRVIDQGAEISTLDVKDGFKARLEQADIDCYEDDNDPLRIFVEDKRYPAIPVTRSIGDAIAESIGVKSEPEILQKTLTGMDKFLIIATHGVWEFITPQVAVDIVGQYSDPLEGAQALMKEAYRLWLSFDEVTADLSAVVVQFNKIKKSHWDTVKRRNGTALGINAGWMNVINAMPGLKVCTKKFISLTHVFMLSPSPEFGLPFLLLPSSMSFSLNYIFFELILLTSSLPLRFLWPPSCMAPLRFPYHFAVMFFLI